MRRFALPPPEPWETWEIRVVGTGSLPWSGLNAGRFLWRADWRTQGSFLIEGISPCLATLEITAAGYAPDTAQIPVRSGTTTNVTIAC
jgi:hypothetical protein